MSLAIGQRKEMRLRHRAACDWKSLVLFAIQALMQSGVIEFESDNRGGALLVQ